MQQKRDDSFGAPDALNPEWDAYASAWSVNAADFDGPLDTARFLARRKRIFAEAQSLGIPKEMLSPFHPDKPGFEGRVGAAFARMASVAGFAAE